MKKISIFVAMLLGALILVSCNNVAPDAESKALSDKNVLGLSVVSSANILSKNSLQPLAQTSSHATLKTLSNDVISEPNMEFVNSYLQMMEGLLVDGGPIVKTEGVSDNELYEEMVVFEVTNLDNTKSTYTVYYTISSENLVDNDIDDDDDEYCDNDHNRDGICDNVDRCDDCNEYEDKKHKQKGHKHHDLDDLEEEYLITGIAIIDGVTYELFGKKEIEQNESELEYVIKLDDKNYVTISEEIEDDEVEYKYTIIKNGKKFSTFSFEKEENAEFEIKFTTTENGYKEVYKFEKDVKNGKEVIVIKYNNSQTKLTIVVSSYVDSQTQETIYNYKVVEKDSNYQFKGGKHHSK